MVMSKLGRAALCCASVLALLVLGQSCVGETQRSGNQGSEATEGEGGADATGNEDAWAITFDRRDCAERPTGDCAGIRESYGSNGAFDGTPALAHCSQYNSFDGCGRLTFDFDADGCLKSVNAGAPGWEANAHLDALRDCVAEVLMAERWTCRASGELRFEESCFVF